MEEFKNFEVLDDKIVFSFHDEVKNGFFVKKHKSGIIMDVGNNHQYSSKYCRVATVHHVGPNVPNIQPNDVVVIQALRWSSTSFNINGKRMWMTDKKGIIGTIQ